LQGKEIVMPIARSSLAGLCLAALLVLASRSPAQLPGGATEEERLRKEQATLQKKVEHEEEEVIRWEAEVSARPGSLVAPVGLRSAKESLSHYRAELEIVNLRLKRLRPAETKPAAPSAATPLVKLLEHGNPDVRRAAAEALARMGPAASEAVPALRDCLKDRDAGVRDAARKALADVERGTPGEMKKPVSPPVGTAPTPPGFEKEALQLQLLMLEQQKDHLEVDVKRLVELLEEAEKVRRPVPGEAPTPPMLTSIVLFRQQLKDFRALLRQNLEEQRRIKEKLRRAE
jgi:hypothetical protein